MDEPILQARDLRFSYGQRAVLKGLDFTVQRGRYTSVIGSNGSGKTTLLRLLSGERTGAGELLYESVPVARMSIRERARYFAVVRQNEENNFPFTCIEMVLLGLHPFRSRFGEPTAEQRKRVLEIMEETGILQMAEKPVTQISGGEFQRVVLARALAQNPKVLFLDEAMSELDISARITFMKLLRRQMEKSGMTVVAISHDLPSAYQYSDNVIALRDGEIYAAGSPEAVMDEAFFALVFAVKTEVFPGKGFLIHDNI